MKRYGWIRSSIAAVAVLLFFTGCQREEAGTNRDAGNPVQAGQDGSGHRGAAEAVPYGEPEIVADKLNVPWDLAFAPDGRMFFTERPGTIRVIEDGKLLAEPVFAFSGQPFVSTGESGLLGLTLDPDFAANGYIYTYHSYEMNGIKNRVLRLVLEGNKAKLDRVLLADIPGQRNHDGGRIRFGPDGLLYVTTGDAEERELSQTPGSLAGKILRIRSDGTIPADNPDPKSPVYSYGHRNPQGLAWQPGSRRLFSSEHGQTSKDEINIIEKGANYGWPLIEGDAKEAKQPLPAGTVLRTPLLHSGASVTWAPSGMTFIANGPWKGRLLVAGLRGEQVLKLTLEGADPVRVTGQESLWKGQFGRIRNVTEGPDGSLYLLTNNRDGRGTPAASDDRIIRFKPK